MPTVLAIGISRLSPPQPRRSGIVGKLFHLRGKIILHFAFNTCRLKQECSDFGTRRLLDPGAVLARRPSSITETLMKSFLLSFLSLSPWSVSPTYLSRDPNPKLR